MDFEILNRELIYHGRVFDLSRVETRLPNGTVTHYDLVNNRPSVTIVPVDQLGQIWFVRQYRLGVGGQLLELPAGLVEPGEDGLTCAAREIREETGMAAGELKKVGDFYLAPGYATEFMQIYLATNIYPSPLNADADEFLSVCTYPSAEVYQMVRRGEIQDGKTLAALLLAQASIQAIIATM
jgi:ADP-ribose pyrophosphatase